MKEDVYTRLGERLNKNPTRMPLVPEVLEFLQSIFNEEEAQVGADFPLGSHPVEALAEAMEREPEELRAMLESMADKGLVFSKDKDSGVREYSLPPFMPGLIELQLMRGREDAVEVRQAKLIKKMLDGVEEAVKGLFMMPEKARRVIKPALRTLTVEQELPLESGVQPYERVAEVIKAESSFAAAVCHCRQQAKLTGDPCKVKDAPSHTCLYFGSAADYVVDRGFASRATREECMEILEASEKAGLVHNVSNFDGDNIVLCNCCGCCCDFMIKMKKYRGVRMVYPSNFAARIDGDLCIGCGECLDRCQVAAISLDGDAAVIAGEYCIGCGNCATVCPQEAISMVRCAEKAPQPRPDFIVGLGV
ncbi:4Fe-4S ferredoxin iron-sulfur binding domain protein [Desulfatibacillum aliphaticivorans]|uniref:4Fe-4S ferredoxin iron-sulfur binding domain protein n=1 Tax=Desulfatibacillum aliphaticivorans TaxID=218208 RepID=B8F9B1_DESAL|nr:4Fe-4S dicluster-binding protein [Desulfatibacillum aliphaticivorans]ACL02857.1 4Fe-4S ferredoxin iron-sulfur binding domain protein [Desulfatibacillum aliphaticivorans]